MKGYFQGNDTQREVVKRKGLSFRLNIFFLVVFLLFSVLIVRLAILQFIEGQQLSEQESRKQVKPNLIPPIRGNIYDREGYPIAVSKSTQSLYYRNEAGKKPEEIIQLARRLEEIFREYGDKSAPVLTAEEIVERMDVGFNIRQEKTPISNYSFVPRLIKSNLSKKEIAYISEHLDSLKGVEIFEESLRWYDPQTIAVQLVGYLRPFSTARNQKDSYLNYYKALAEQTDVDPKDQYMDNEYVGFDGIEFMYQEELRGENGYKSYPVNAMQEIVGPVSITPPKKGNNLYLTIDKDVQLTAEQAIIDHLKYLRSNEARRLRYPYAPNARSGYAVAMEVKTGKVVAMASMPDYEPWIWHGGISQEDYQRILPFYRNGTITTAYPDYPPEELPKHANSIVYLGSTIKPLTVLIGLNEGLMTPKEKYYDTGIYRYGKNNSFKIQNSGGRAWGSLDATRAIAVSSNTYMAAMVGERLYRTYGTKGLDIWDSYMKQFGLGVLTGSGLPGEIPGVIDYFHEAQTASVQSALVRSVWGQQGRYTTLQLAQYAATLANKGKRPKPIFVEKIESFDGKVLQTFEGTILNEINIPMEYWEVIEKGMEQVSKGGFEGFPYRVAAKTGTSTQSVGGKEVDNAVFIAYAPVEDPVLAVAVVVPEGGYGAWGAAPIARHIFDAYDRKVGLTGTPNPNAPLYIEKSQPDEGQ